MSGRIEVDRSMGGYVVTVGRATSKAEAQASLRRHGVFTDCTIVCGGNTYPAHRVVLASKSKYFHDMFTGQFKEAGDARVEFPSKDEDIVEPMLEALYDPESDWPHIFDLPVNFAGRPISFHVRLGLVGAYIQSDDLATIAYRRLFNTHSDEIVGDDFTNALRLLAKHCSGKDCSELRKWFSDHIIRELREQTYPGNDETPYIDTLEAATGGLAGNVIHELTSTLYDHMRYERRLRHRREKMRIYECKKCKATFEADKEYVEWHCNDQPYCVRCGSRDDVHEARHWLRD